MKYVLIVLSVAVVLAIIAFLIIRLTKHTPESFSSPKETKPFLPEEIPEVEKPKEVSIELEQIEEKDLPKKDRLVAIKDSKTLTRIGRTIPGFAKSASQIAKTINGSSQAIYKAVIPSSAALAATTGVDGAVTGLALDGQAGMILAAAQKTTTIVAGTGAAVFGIVSLVVGQYYMETIDTRLVKVNDRINKISNFQNNEFRSKVYSLISHTRLIAEYRSELLANKDMRLAKLYQLEAMEREASELLGQASLTLSDYARKKEKDYKTYDEDMKEEEDWYDYQRSLLELLYRISDLKYTLAEGALSRKQCNGLLEPYTTQVLDSQARIKEWHQDNVKNLKIDLTENKRTRSGLDKLVHALPSAFKKEKKYEKIDPSTSQVIQFQLTHREDGKRDESELYQSDVELYSINGEVFYLPKEEEEK